MKKSLLSVCLLFVAIQFGFSQKQAWNEAKTFHHFMSTTFHPAEEGNFAPLKEKADSLAWAAERWAKSPIPSNYKEKETKEALVVLAKQSKDILAAVKAKKSDNELKKMITATHDTFHKIVGECKKADE